MRSAASGRASSVETSSAQANSCGARDLRSAASASGARSTRATGAASNVASASTRRRKQLQSGRRTDAWTGSVRSAVRAARSARGQTVGFGCFSTARAVSLTSAGTHERAQNEAAKACRIGRGTSAWRPGRRGNASWATASSAADRRGWSTVSRGRCAGSTKRSRPPRHADGAPLD